MKKSRLTYHIFIVVALLISFSCREEIALETETFENVLVVEATITNEIRYQEVNLSRTFVLESSEPILENNATVYIEDNAQNIITFSQNQEGIYVSDIEFQAQPNIIYTLYVNTTSGENYKSNATTLTPEANISNLYAELVNGDEISVFVDVDGTENNAQYFRYKWEETYKIVAPYHSNFDATVVNYQQFNGQITYDIDITPRNQEEEICYRSKKSTDIIQATSSQLASNIITRFPIRVLDINNSKLITRYSIIVSQITQNIESYSYYKAIKELGNAASILSSNQPGYIQSNISSLSNSNEKVLGFFNVASIFKERIYFNYLDFGINQPDYFYDCIVIDLDYNDNTTQDMDTNERVKLYQLLSLSNYKYISNANSFYNITRPECGDCTSFSSNIQPDFWID